MGNGATPARARTALAIARHSPAFGDVKSNFAKTSVARIDFATDTGSNHTSGFCSPFAHGPTTRSAASTAAAIVDSAQLPSRTSTVARPIESACFAIQLASKPFSAVSVSATDAATSPSWSRTVATTGVDAPVHTRTPRVSPPNARHASIRARPATSSPTAEMSSGAGPASPTRRARPSAMLRATPPGFWRTAPGVDEPARSRACGPGEAVTSRTMPPTTTAVPGCRCAAHGTIAMDPRVVVAARCATRRRAASARTKSGSIAPSPSQTRDPALDGPIEIPTAPLLGRARNFWRGRCLLARGRCPEQHL